MGKYEPLARYLKSLQNDTWNASFAEIESRLGFALPQSARQYRAWWANQKGSNHSQTAGWQNAGWETDAVDLHRGTVTFSRRRRIGGNASSTISDADLWQQAREISGIEDRDELVRKALQTLIRHEAASSLAALGGSMPDYRAPERERPAK